MTAEAPYTIRSVQRVCDILDLVQERPDGMSLVDVAEATGLPKSSAFRYLATLEERSYVFRLPTGDFTVGIALRSERIDVLVQRAQPYLEKLRDELGETVNLGMLDDGRITYLEICESRSSLRNAPRSGDRSLIHNTALGKALAARLSDAEVLAILDRTGMPAASPNTIIRPADYLTELVKVRKLGYAVDDREDSPHGRCVAVAIEGTRLPVAFSVSAPASRLPMQAVASVADELSAAARAFSGSHQGPTRISGDAAGKERP